MADSARSRADGSRDGAEYRHCAVHRRRRSARTQTETQSGVTPEMYDKWTCQRRRSLENKEGTCRTGRRAVARPA